MPKPLTGQVAPAKTGWLKQELLSLGEWLDALEWTPENVDANLQHLCLSLKNERQHVWKHFLPRVGEGLSCMGHDPDALYQTLVRATGAVHIKMEANKPLAMLLASVRAKLPDRFIRQAIGDGGLLLVLENKSYPVPKRLDWLRKYKHSVLYQGDVLMHMERTESPIKDALALWCFFEATQGNVDFNMWRVAGVTWAAASSKRFLKKYVPQIVEHLGMIQTLELSYTDLVTMLINVGDGAGAAPMLDLPDLVDVARLSNA
jgi:hypothetical protein